MRQGDDVPGKHLEPHYLAGKTAVHDHEGSAFGVQQVHHLDAVVIHNAMHLDHCRFQAHPAPHQYPLVRPQTRKPRLGPLPEARVAVGPDPVNPMPRQPMKVSCTRPVSYQPAHIRFELCLVGHVLHNPLEILLVGWAFDRLKLVIVGSREHVEGTRLRTGISRVPTRSALEGLYRTSGGRTCSHAILLAHG